MQANLRILRTALALLVAISFASAAAGVWHTHTDNSATACQVCHVAHLPALEVAPSAQVDPPLLARVHVSAEDVFLHAAPLVSIALSRAPPSVQ